MHVGSGHKIAGAEFALGYTATGRQRAEFLSMS